MSKGLLQGLTLREILVDLHSLVSIVTPMCDNSQGVASRANSKGNTIQCTFLRGRGISRPKGKG